MEGIIRAVCRDLRRPTLCIEWTRGKFLPQDRISVNFLFPGNFLFLLDIARLRRVPLLRGEINFFLLYFSRTICDVTG